MDEQVITKETCYKIVRPLGNEFWSLTIESLNIGSVQYRLGEWVRPQEHCGPLAVFDTLKNLKRFMTDYLWSPIDSAVFFCNIKLSTQSTLWYYDRSNPKRQIAVPTIKGTILADEVCIFKRINLI